MLNLVFWSSLSLANDVDGDGVEDVVDCDDNDASVGEPTDVYYVDADGDGYGSSETEWLLVLTCLDMSPTTKIVTTAVPMPFRVPHQTTL